MLWLLPIGVLAIASASILIRLTPADPVAITFWRLFLATVMVFALGMWRGFTLPSARAAAYSAASGLLLAIHFLSWIPSLFLTTVAASTTLVNIHPVVLLLISRLIREKVGLSSAVGVAAATAGALMITFSPGGLLGNLLAIVGALAFAGYIALGRLVRQEANTWGYTLVAYGTASLVALLFGLAAKSNLFAYDWRVFVMFLLVASVPMMMGHTVFNYLLGRYRAVTIAASTLGEPVGAALLALAVLGEAPTGYVGPVPLQALGVATTLVGISLVVREEVKRGDSGKP